MDSVEFLTKFLVFSLLICIFVAKKCVDMRKIVCVLLVMLMPVVAFAGDGEGKQRPWFLKGLYWVKTLIDSSAVAGKDRSYIEQPKKPWAVELRSEATQTSMKATSSWYLDEEYNGSTTSRTDNGFSTSIGAWLGYRGYGFGLSKELTGGDGSTISFGAMGGSFGINLRINFYRSSQPELQGYHKAGDWAQQFQETLDMDDPIHVRSLFLDGYYFFNGKRFSYAAAYDQSLIQRRSAGSLVAGLMYFHSKMAYDDQSNWPLILLTNDEGRVTFTQANIGAGYAYNWVPAKGWLVSGMVMPMLTFYNRMNSYTYDILTQDGRDLFQLSDEELEHLYEDEEAYRSVVVKESGVNSTRNKVGWNFDARLSVVYNWKRTYLRVYGHYNRFHYDNDESAGRLTEWHVYASLGYRF